MAKKILVVDDDDEMVDFVALSLRTAGYEVISAHDGKEGLEAARRAKPDLMLLDLNMPIMHGFEVCERVRTDAELKSLKIIVTSAKSYLVDVKKAMRLGADRYMIKPYPVSELTQAISELLAAA